MIHRKQHLHVSKSKSGQLHKIYSSSVYPLSNSGIMSSDSSKTKTLSERSQELMEAL